MTALKTWCEYVGKWGTTTGSWSVARSSIGYYFKFYNNEGGTKTIDSPIAPVINKWTHVAVVRKGMNIYMFVDGVRTGNTLNVENKVCVPTTNPVRINGDGGAYNQSSTGYYDAVKIHKGSCSIRK